MLVFLLAVVGAIVGAATNALAIRMLFRPHRAYYIGKWQPAVNTGTITEKTARACNADGKFSS
ncbi:hypothetical protein [Shouchella lehensis]|uniref:hypothetical protein n=1 Tax=Shouchella lehensis TaxID=300825 RepID=UPI00130EAB76|nr:hypothetical protein [Shouchella lehensis]